MQTRDQLLDMLTTIEEAETFLRKRCAAGMAGQSLQLFEDLFSLIELIQHRFKKTEFLPLRAPVFRDQIDVLTAVALLDQVQIWVEAIRGRLRRQVVRQQLARGGVLGAAEGADKPYVDTAKAFLEMSRSGAAAQSSVGKATPVLTSVTTPEPAPAKRFDAAQESARLARALIGAGVRGDQSQESAVKKQALASEEAPTAARQMGAAKPDIEQTAEAPTAARQMGAAKPDAEKSAEAPTAARQMGAAKPDAEKSAETPTAARPMGAAKSDAEKPAESPTAARPMGAEKPDAERSAETPTAARPMGAAKSDTGKSAESQTAARPMGAEKPAKPQPTSEKGGINTVDRAFKVLMDQMEPMNEKQIAGKMIGAFPKLENRYKMVIIDYLRRFPYWGALDPDKDIYEVFSRRAEQLVQHRRDFLWLYDRLGDYRSKKTLLAILDNWYSFNFKDLTNMKERLFPNYFDFDLLRGGGQEVFVDLGAYTGEVTRSFIDSYGGYKKIYCYEIDEGNFTALRDNFSDIPNVELRHKGIGDRAGMSYVSAFGDASTSRLSEQGGQQVEIATLDQDLQGAVTMIKMNLEGGEQAALQGCGEHIHRSRPKLIIRLDHQNEDLWKIPRMVDRLEPKYKLYLRHYGGNLVPAEYVLFAV